MTRPVKDGSFVSYILPLALLKSTAIHYRQIGVAKVVMGQIIKKHGESLSITNSGNVEEIGC